VSPTFISAWEPHLRAALAIVTVEKQADAFGGWEYLETKRPKEAV